MHRINKDDQPDLETKLRALSGEPTGWDYYFGVPPVPHNLWSQHDWVNYIGAAWFRTTGEPK